MLKLCPLNASTAAHIGPIPTRGTSGLPLKPLGGRRGRWRPPLLPKSANPGWSTTGSSTGWHQRSDFFQATYRVVGTSEGRLIYAGRFLADQAKGKGDEYLTAALPHIWAEATIHAI